MFKHVDLSEITVAADQFFNSCAYFQPVIA